MELKYPYVIYIGLAILVFILLFRLGKTVLYKSGKKISGLTYLEDDPMYKKRLVIYKFLRVLTSLFCIIAYLAGVVLISRPYKTEITIKDETNRDIVLCLDVSTSVDELNETLCDKLIETVNGLQGERFGIVIFNTSPVLLCPLTDDYEYVIESLETIKKALKERNNYYYSFSSDLDDDWDYLYNYIYSGTITDCETRGSSLIGDGLAATINNFTGIGTDDERTRVVIFSTDNDLQGSSYFTTKEAAELLKKNKIICYGICPDFMYYYGNLEEEMREAMEITGGQLFVENESGTVENIIKNITDLEATRVEVKKEYKDVDYPMVPFVILLVSLSMMFVCTRISKR